MRGKAKRIARPEQTRLQNSGVTGPKFTKFFIRRRKIVGGLNEFFHVAITDPLLNASAQNKGGVRQFSPIRSKNRLPWKRPLSDRKTTSSG